MSAAKNPGRVAGGRKAAKTVKDRYGSNFYREIGARGGRITSASHGSISSERIGRKGGEG